MYLALDHTVPRSKFVDEVLQWATFTGVSRGLRDFIFRLMSTVSPDRYMSTDLKTLCFASQGRLARMCGVTEGQVRRYERELVRLGLIANDTPSNGRRDRATGSGLSLEPMIALREKILHDLAEQDRAEREHQRLRGVRGRLARRFRALSHDAAECGLVVPAEVDAERGAWPRSDTLQRLSLPVLTEHIAQCEDLCQRLAQCLNPSKMHGEPCADARYVIQTQENTITVSCTEADALRADENVEGGEAEVLPLSQAQFEEIAGPAFKLYRSVETEQRLNPRQFIAIAWRIAHEFGISQDALNAPELSPMQVALCIFVIDAKLGLDPTSVANPGGYLRGMAAAAKDDSLHLVGSLIGLSKAANPLPRKRRHNSPKKAFQ